MSFTASSDPETSPAAGSRQQRTAKDYAFLGFTGMAMGAADVVPGVSGGTMAFILGAYRELIDAIRSFDLRLVRKVLARDVAGVLAQVPWRFLLPLFTGIAVSVLSLSHAVTWLLEHHQVYLYAFFFGLVAASIVTVSSEMEWSPKTAAGLVLGTILAYWVVGLVPVAMPHDPLTLFFSGMIAISAMILPGISGSFLLLILGQYAFVLAAVKGLDVVTLIPFAAGCGVGILGFARVLSWLFTHHYRSTITLLVGFMLGSLRKIWPFKEVVSTRIDRHGEVVPLEEHNLLPALAAGETWIALGLAVAGFLAILALDRIRRRMVEAELA
ncbi:MAG: DUF368 domain-containing protein [Holophagales bacterium]|nr:DUF368 domain-containing protein [Holophagales bacterium]